MLSNDFDNLFSEEQREERHPFWSTNFNKLEIIFEKRKVSGLSACIPEQGEEINPINLDGINNIKSDDIGEPNHMKEDSRRGAKRKGMKSPNKKSKNDMVQVMANMVVEFYLLL
jgi:hypothetical protein